MEAGELKIGNWLICDSNSKEYKYTEVYKIDNEDEFYINDLTVEEFSPIQLTPEILGNCGFEKAFPEWIKSLHEFQNWYYWNNNKNEIEICL